MSWTITSLRVGELFLPHEGAFMRDPIHCWLVRGGGHNILVDSGMPDVATIHGRLRVDGVGGGHNSLIRLLASEGLAPGDIDVVLPTHLHFDHAGNLELFPNAQVVVQRDELFHALDPVPSQRIFYWREMLASLTDRKRGKQLRLVDGNFTLFDGIEVIKSPGHTPGMQIPVVSTDRGKAALVSDLGDHYRYWFPDDPRATDSPKRYLTGDFLTGNIRSESERTWQRSMREITERSDIVVPAHDFRIPMRMPEQWWARPSSTADDLAHTPYQEAAE
jgi:glyoxylase-like metal-dependent hydrolase (beta-lactamase superfamily II)